MSNSEQTNIRREKFAELLRNMFQLNQPELDFGIYRIMHARKDDINRFIEIDLPRLTTEAFEGFQTQDKSQIAAALDKARQAAVAAGFDPEESPKVKELAAQLDIGVDVSREEGEVYDALLTFFDRYYDEGDFISRRVYKDGAYAVPYNGEEVVLHWANKDQYYIKSSETLRDYSFRLDIHNEENPQRVHFRIVDAEAGAQNNNKESDDGKRCFVLDAENPFQIIDGEKSKELEINFNYQAATIKDWTASAKKSATAAAVKKPPTQDVLRKIAVDFLLGDEGLPKTWKARLAVPYTKSNGEKADYSLLQGRLENYQKKNQFDYFIHKDLDGFLSREFDFYIKNELFRWEDVSALKGDPSRLGPMLSKIEVIRGLGEKIITFLAQLENFQRKLWLKKKFVTETNYCITVDRLQKYEDMLAEIFEHQPQLDQWKSLYALDLKKMKKDYEKMSWEDFLAIEKYRYLMADTGLFDESFKARLIAAIDGLDGQCDGVLINSDNFQALNLLQNKLQDRISNIY